MFSILALTPFFPSQPQSADPKREDIIKWGIMQEESRGRSAQSQRSTDLRLADYMFHKDDDPSVSVSLRLLALYMHSVHGLLSQYRMILFVQRISTHNLTERFWSLSIPLDMLSSPPKAMTELPTMLVPLLENFVVAINDTTEAQLAVGRSMRHIWKNEKQAPFYYIARDKDETLRWGIALGVHKYPWKGTYNGPHIATVMIDNDDALRARLPLAKEWVDAGPRVTVAVVLNLDNQMSWGQSDKLEDSADDIRPLLDATKMLNKELDRLFRRRRLLCAALPYLEKDHEPVIVLMVRGFGTPIDEEPLPAAIGGMPTRIVVGQAPRPCVDLKPESSLNKACNAAPLRHGSLIEGPKLSGSAEPGSFGAYVIDSRNKICVATAAHVLMDRDEAVDYKYDDKARDEYASREVFHPVDNPKNYVEVGKRFI